MKGKVIKVYRADMRTVKVTVINFPITDAASEDERSLKK